MITSYSLKIHIEYNFSQSSANHVRKKAHTYAAYYRSGLYDRT